MTILSKIKTYLGGAQKEKGAAEAYDLWALSYDDQPGNLTLALEGQIFEELFNQINVKDKVVADIGCGTGRHWPAIMDHQPARLVGYDVSAGMLQALQEKFPHAETYQPNGFLLPQLAGHSVDILLTTLAIAHMPGFAEILVEWDRVLKPGAVILITDYHPASLQKGGARTFTYQNKLIAIKNYVYSLEEIRKWISGLHWKEEYFTERIIDESVKHYYEEKAALHVYERFKNTALVYGMLLKKPDATR